MRKIICCVCGYNKVQRIFLYDDKYCSPSKWGTKGIITACGKCLSTIIIERGTWKTFRPKDWFDYSILDGIPESIIIKDSKAICDKHQIEINDDCICSLCLKELVK